MVKSRQDRGTASEFTEMKQGAFMKKQNHFVKLLGCVIMFMLIFSGCSENFSDEKEPIPTETEASERENEENQESSERENENQERSESENEEKQERSEAAESEEDWSEYFGGLHGAAVLYDPLNRQFKIYNQELAAARRSPCSTFKIISSLTALEHRLLMYFYFS